MDKDCALVASGLALVPPLSARIVKRGRQLLARQQRTQMVAPMFFIKISQHPDTVRAGNLQCRNALLVCPFQQPARACRSFHVNFLEHELLGFKKTPCLAAYFGTVHIQNQFHIIPRQTPKLPVSIHSTLLSVNEVPSALAPTLPRGRVSYCSPSIHVPEMEVSVIEATFRFISFAKKGVMDSLAPLW